MDRSPSAPMMRVSFDLDEVLFVSPRTHRTEPAPPFPWDRIFPERLRLGTPELIRSLQAADIEHHQRHQTDQNHQNGHKNVPFRFFHTVLLLRIFQQRQKLVHN